MKKKLMLLLPAAAAAAIVLCLLPRFAPSGAAECLTADIPAPSFDMSRTQAETDYTPEIRFSLRMFYQGLSREKGDFCCSPVSMLLPLAALETGAKGETLDVLARELGREPSETLSAAASIMARLAYENRDTAELLIGNSFWFSPILTAEKSFLSTVKGQFNADVFRLPLDKKAVDSMNSWAEKRTNGRSKDLVSGDLLPKSTDKEITAFYLINTVYLDALWESPFGKNDTRDGAFHMEDGKEAEIPFMGTGEFGGTFSMIKTGEANGVVLPYRDGDLVFVALRPDRGSVSGFASSLTAERFREYIQSAEKTRCVLRMPKIDRRFSHMWKEDLQNMGLALLFEPNCDLSGVGRTSAGNLYLAQAGQSVYIRVDEKGTEAAAGSALKGTSGGVGSDLPRYFLDSPFIYAVVDLETCLPLFMGVFTGGK